MIKQTLVVIFFFFFKNIARIGWVSFSRWVLKTLRVVDSTIFDSFYKLNFSNYVQKIELVSNPPTRTSESSVLLLRNFKNKSQSGYQVVSRFIPPSTLHESTKQSANLFNATMLILILSLINWLVEKLLPHIYLDYVGINPKCVQTGRGNERMKQKTSNTTLSRNLKSKEHRRYRVENERQKTRNM